MKKGIAMFTASVMLMGAMQLSAFAETAAPQTIPFAVPDTYSETVDFLNNYGNIYVQDDYICFCGRFSLKIPQRSLQFCPKNPIN